MIRTVGVVVPARDEKELLPACLASVNLAGRLVPDVRVHLIVVADTCGDRTASLAAQAGATAVEGTMTNVGQARLAGTRIAPGVWRPRHGEGALSRGAAPRAPRPVTVTGAGRALGDRREPDDSGRPRVTRRSP
ncbi:hypothetical protein AB0G15_33010 [Streptosporangium sp. NPDC023825]|uniref:hypothetical protein n=1 Tax=Streptosporangium sp. NPDC023825 TaxID=3154909 RepID=UPI00343178F4